MRKLNVFLFFLVMFVLFSCGTSPDKKVDQKPRLTIVEQVVQNSQRFAIVRIDSVEFFVTDAGVYRLNNCN